MVFHTVAAVTTTPPEYDLTTSDAAARLNASVDAVQRWADDGRLPCLRTPGGFRRFREVDVETFGQSMLPKAAS